MFKIMPLVACLIAVIISCETQQPQPEKKSTPAMQPVARPFSMLDSLDKYSGADSLVDCDTLRFYIGKINRKDFALFELNDSTTFLYQKDKNKWAVTDTLPYPISPHVEVQDLNGDHIKDIKVVYYRTGAGGNEQVYCLLFNHKTGRLIHNPAFDLPNILYDPKKRLVYSAWWSGVVHAQDKMSFRITGDSLTFNEGVTYIPDEKSYKESGAVEFYREQAGQRIVVKKLQGPPEKVWRIFSRAIWDSSNRD